MGYEKLRGVGSIISLVVIDNYICLNNTGTVTYRQKGRESWYGSRLPYVSFPPTSEKGSSADAGRAGTRGGMPGIGDMFTLEGTVYREDFRLLAKFEAPMASEFRLVLVLRAR